MEFQKRITPGMSLEQFLEAQAAQQIELEEYLTQMINAKHAPIMVPRSAIDAATPEFTIATTAFAKINFQHTDTNNTTTQKIALNYIGRGILQKLVICETTTGGAGAFDASIELLIDGTPIYSNATAITTQSSMRVIVGDMSLVESTALVHVGDDYPGIPFNSQCAIGFNRGATAGIVTIGWKLAKKYE